MISNSIKVTIVAVLIIIACTSIVFVRSIGTKKRIKLEPYDLNFDKIDSYYINLDRAIDRKKIIEKQFKDQDLNVKRWSAVDGSKINIENPQYNLKHMKDWLKQDKKHIRHFACSLSHLEIMKKYILKNPGESRDRGQDLIQYTEKFFI